MRKLLMTAALVTLLALPVLAQFRGGFGRGMGGGQNILMNKSVQDELKLDDKQKEALKEIRTKQQENGKKARELFKDGEGEKAKELMTKSRDETTKALDKFRDGLTSTQKKRLTECEIQVATKRNDLGIFKNAAVEKILKLTDKQKDKIKEIQSDLEKDIREVFEEGGKGNFKKNIEKANNLRKDAFAKANKELTETQAKALKDAAGEKFEFKEENPFGGGKGKFKGKRGDKGGKDDL
jgi:Spy/CpxP family protein refolding chaperone